MEGFVNIPLPIFYCFASLLGACLGSFATCLIYRLPQRIPVVFGKAGQRSICPTCKRKLKPIDLIPIISWLCSGGRCRYCGQRISVLYPIIELSCATACGLIAWHYGMSLQSAVLITTVPILMAIFVIDFYYKIIPDWLNLWLLLLGVAWVYVSGADWQEHGLTALIYCGFSYALRWVFSKVMKREAMGLGDVKFFAGAGLWLGLTVFSAFLFFAGVIGIVLAGLRRLTSDDPEIPFGPALVLSFIICLVFETPIVKVLQTGLL